MCGIVGYVGERNATPIIIDGLSRLEYRGYDSAGIAVLNDQKIAVFKSVGRLATLIALLETKTVKGTIGIGHTRWATHGEPSNTNAHPHSNSGLSICVVHNGIIENYQSLRQELTKEGYAFQSETDTEVIPHLLEREIKKAANDIRGAVLRVIRLLRGAYALCILVRDDAHTIYGARKGSPLIIGLGKNENFIASDVPAVLPYVKQAIYLNDGEVAVVTKDRYEVCDLQGKNIPHKVHEIKIRAESVDRSGFETFMLKEIHEQPRILRYLLDRYVATSKDQVLLPIEGISRDFLKSFRRTMFVSCGTAYYAGFYGKLIIERLSDIAAEIDLASEFRYRAPKIDKKTLVIAVSQSGETADTLASIRLARSIGCPVLSICNVPGSTLTRESDAVLYTEAGLEIGVASTKAFTSQLMMLALLAIYLGQERGLLSRDNIKTLLEQLDQVPNGIHYVLQEDSIIEGIANKHHDGPSALYLGRRFNYPIALEGALKNKEISYQHAEGYAAGELKHGPIALINEYLPVVCICTKTDDELYEKMISNLKEVEARHGRIIAIANENDQLMPSIAEDIIQVPEVREEFSPLVNVIALQLLAYYSARARGTDIDKPRNLAKSVTVE